MALKVFFFFFFSAFFRADLVGLKDFGPAREAEGFLEILKGFRTYGVGLQDF